MLFCRDCGHCELISEDQFHAYVNVYASQVVYLDSRGEVTDYGDVGDFDGDGNGYDEIFCPYCDGSHIEDCDPDEDEAQGIRESYDLIQAQRQREYREQRRRDEAREHRLIESEWNKEVN
jgi:hypothetical protein